MPLVKTKNRKETFMDMDLFDGDARWSSLDGQACRIFQAWRATVGCKPIPSGKKMQDTIEQRIKEALAMGYQHKVVFDALEDAWNYRQAKPDGTSAWMVALDIAQKKNKPQLTDTQNRILGLSSGEVRRAT